MLHITSATEKIIYDEPTVSTLLESAKKEGFTTIRQDALLKLLEGITTIEEVVRETGPLA